MRSRTRRCGPCRLHPSCIGDLPHTQPTTQLCSHQLRRCTDLYLYIPNGYGNRRPQVHSGHRLANKLLDCGILQTPHTNRRWTQRTVRAGLYKIQEFCRIRSPRSQRPESPHRRRRWKRRRWRRLATLPSDHIFRRADTLAQLSSLDHYRRYSYLRSRWCSGRKCRMLHRSARQRGLRLRIGHLPLCKRPVPGNLR